MIQADLGLILAVEKIITAANSHKVRTLLAKYSGAIYLANELGKEDFEAEALEYEHQIRDLLFELSLRNTLSFR